MTGERRLFLVLVRPRYAGNVGSVLRLAANFRVAEVGMVAPEFDPDDPDLIRMAVGAQQTVRLREMDSLQAAVAECDLVIATSSSRDRDPRVVLDLEEAVARAAAAPARRLALVFGPERGGLRREEFHLAHMAATIPANPDFPVLNLAQAAAVVVSAFSRDRFEALAPSEPLDRPAEAAEVHAALAHLREVLLATGYLDQHNPDRVMEQIGRLVGRAIPTRREVAILRGIASHVRYLAREG